jgi:hypothetical protein
VLEVVDQVVGPVPAQLVGPGQEDVTAHPEHRGGADHRQPGEQLGHTSYQHAAEALR